MSDILTSSSTGTARNCLRKYRLAYGYGIRRKQDAKPLVIGTAGHKIIEMHERMKAIGFLGTAEELAADAITMGLADYDATRPTDPEKIYDWEIDRVTVATLCAAYFWRWAEVDAGVEVIATELQFQIPLINPESGRSSRTFDLAGKIDNIIRRTDSGRIGIRDHKFIGQDLAPESDYWRKLKIDQQMSIYFDAADHLGHRPDFIELDAIRKPTISPKGIPLTDEQGVKVVLDRDGNRVRTKDGKKWRESGLAEEGYTLQTRPETPEEFGERLRQDIGERPDFYFARREFARLDAEREEAAFDLWQTGEIIRECAAKDRWPRNTGHCFGFGRCQFFNLCTGGFKPETDELPEEFERVANPHRELDLLSA